MSDTPARTSVRDGELTMLTRRVEAVESLLVLLPMLITEALLVLSLFLPFVSDEAADDEETVNLFGLIGGLFGGADDEGPDRAEVLFGVAFLVLLVVILAAIFVLPLTAGRGRRGAASGTLSVVAVLLALGTLGAWSVMGMGMSNDDWTLQPALPVLSAAALLAALLVFLPAYRSIWAD